MRVLVEKSSRKTSKTLRAAVLTVVVVVVALGIYAIFTYPKTVVSFPVSFTIGADVERREFDMPLLHGWVQVEVVVGSGTTLWNAKILSDNDVFWEHSAHQGGQTTYKSGWVELPSGTYNFTFATAGLGSLEAQIKVASKGGFW